MADNSKKGNRKFSLKGTNRRRLFLVFVSVLILMTVLIIRIVQLDATSSTQSQREALAQISKNNTEIPYKRGSIMDRNGTVLAQSEQYYRIILDTSVMADLKIDDAYTYTAELLHKFFGFDEQDILDQLNANPDAQYIRLDGEISYEDKKKCDDYIDSLSQEDSSSAEGDETETAKSEEELQKDKDEVSLFSQKAIWFEMHYKRNYPYSTLASDVIGFTSGDGSGLWGLENYYDSDLTGTDGRTYTYVKDDVTKEQVTQQPTDGYSIVSTIDVNLQRICEDKLNEFASETGSDHISALIMDPNNGEILAMASAPGFDLNNPDDLSECGYTDELLDSMTDEEKSELCNEVWKNFCVNDSYEPGSTAKTMTMSYALDNGYVDEDDTFDCYGGLTYTDGTLVRCNDVHGTVTLRQALMYSCNTALMYIGESIGASNFVRMQDVFGLGQLTGIDLPGEQSCASLVYTEDSLGPVELWTSSFGQGYNVNMVQLAAAFSSIVNGGKYYKPHIVSSIQDSKGSTVKVFNTSLMRSTISEETSEWMRESLYEVVESGTGTPARVAGYKIGGKTGTSEVGERGTEDRLVSFIAAAPIDDPQIVVYVVIDKPHTVSQDHSSFASVLVSRILKEALPYLQIFPTEDVTEQEAYEIDLEKENIDALRLDQTLDTITGLPSPERDTETESESSEGTDESTDSADTGESADTADTGESTDSEDSTGEDSSGDASEDESTDSGSSSGAEEE
ncbi:MAG: penicillin-binding transpeptidase domain-containing protein [Lachnospiraceae bacterium]|jgi:stage V sporulation protein D (sporulation-specific penicillin-binding protein)